MAAELVRVIRKIAQVEERLAAIEAEMAQLKRSPLYELKTKVEETAEEGQDLLAEMASRAKEHIADARQRLAAITRKGREV